MGSPPEVEASGQSRKDREGELVDTRFQPSALLLAGSQAPEAPVVERLGFPTR